VGFGKTKPAVCASRLRDRYGTSNGDSRRFLVKESPFAPPSQNSDASSLVQSDGTGSGHLGHNVVGRLSNRLAMVVVCSSGVRLWVSSLLRRKNR